MLDHRFSELPELDEGRVRIVVVVALRRHTKAQQQGIMLGKEAEIAGGGGVSGRQDELTENGELVKRGKTGRTSQHCCLGYQTACWPVSRWRTACLCCLRPGSPKYAISMSISLPQGHTRVRTKVSQWLAAAHHPDLHPAGGREEMAASKPAAPRSGSR
jgi:hypothetical protein